MTAASGLAVDNTAEATAAGALFSDAAGKYAVLADGAERYLALTDFGMRRGFAAGNLQTKKFDANEFDARAFAAMPEEIRLRTIGRIALPIPAIGALFVA